MGRPAATWAGRLHTWAGLTLLTPRLPCGPPRQHIAENAQLADAAEAEKYVSDMVATGAISATIDQPQGMVQFSERQARHNHFSTVDAPLRRAAVTSI